MNKTRLIPLLLYLSGALAWKNCPSGDTVAFTGAFCGRQSAKVPEEKSPGAPDCQQSRESLYFSETTSTSRLYMAARSSNHTGAIGNGPNHPKRSSSSTELSASFVDVAAMGYKVYCDLDGVLVDFEKGVHKLFRTPSSQLVKGTMWKHIARTNGFYEYLDWTPDGKRLWGEIRHLRPNILTGVPYPKSSRIEKYNWCKRELGLQDIHHVDMAAGSKDHESVNGNVPKEDVTNVITCWSNNKHMESNDRSVLIDDRECAREPWEKAGGVFIHHIDAETTLQRLRDRGIL